MSGSARAFLDTNVLVCAFDAGEPAKQERALQLLDRVGDSLDATISTQVLQEFFVVVTRKLERPLNPGAAEEVVRSLTALPVVQTDPDLVLQAIGIGRRHQLALWDALIVAAALRGGCAELLSEDLQDGFRVDGLQVRNPFQ